MEYEIRMRGGGRRSTSSSGGSSSDSSSSGEGSACSLMSAGNWLETLYGQHMAAAAAFQFPGSAALLLGQLRSATRAISSGGGAPEPMVWKSEPPDEDDAHETTTTTTTTKPDKEQLTEIKQEPSEVNVKLENDEDDRADDETPPDAVAATAAAADAADDDRAEDDNPDDEASVESWKDKGVPNVLSSWFLNAYTTMLGRLSFVAAAASFDDALLNSRSNLTSDSRSGSESGHSSYLDALHRSRESSPSNSSSAKRKPSAKSAKVASRRRKKTVANVDAKLRSLEGKSPAASLSEGKKRTLALQRVRYEREEYRCYLCPYACTIEKAFQRHLRAHARGTADAGQMPRLSCAVCGADRSSELDLSKHMRRHRDNRYFCCDICIFRTVQLKKLIQHRRMHTGEKPHLCPHCAYRSARRDNLRSHVRRVHKKENLFCDTFSPRGMFNISKIAALADESNDENDNDDERDADDDRNNVDSQVDIADERDDYTDDNNDNETNERIGGVHDVTMQLQQNLAETPTET